MPSDAPAFFASEWTRAQPIVHNYVLAILRHPQDVDDVVQEVAVTACKDIDRFDRSRSFLPWVLSIARFRAIDYQRKRGRDKMVFNVEALKAIEDATISLAPDENERAAALRQCLKTLQPKAARVVNLRYESNLSVQEIAKQFSKSPNAISIVLFRARAALLTCIEKVLQQRESR
ncbi:MAG: sigma-70 family RNA polymerase sigma factor [Phycisphaerales bacterium JB063]